MASTDLALEILRRGVLCVPGSAFGGRGEDHLRFSYANTQENIKRAMDLIRPLAQHHAGRVP
jgi:aspartate/methionine/tyrosine aminotransferase